MQKFTPHRYQEIKQAYYDIYFERNWNDIKNTWKGIKSLICLKYVVFSVTTLSCLNDGDTTTNPYDIANTFNNFFASIAGTAKGIKYSYKRFSDNLSDKSDSATFLQPTEKEEITNILSPINSSETSGQNSIPYRILLLLIEYYFF